MPPFLLPRGVTGFYGHRDDAPGSVALDAFARACHAAAREAGFAVIAIEGAGLARNNHHALLRRDRIAPAAITILCNAQVPLVAFAQTPLRPGAPPSFVDADDLAEAFARFAADFEVLPCRVLTQPVTPKAIAALNPTELAQVRSWKPERVGDVVFNGWD